MIGLLVFIVVAFGIIVIRGRVIVPPDSAYVVERFGVYRETLNPGIHFVTPIVERIAFRHSLAEQEETLSQTYTTLDRQPIQMTSAFRFRIVDPQRASYATVDPLHFVRELVRNAQRRLIEERAWDSLREERRSFQQDVLREVSAAAENAGVKVTEHEVRELKRA